PRIAAARDFFARRSRFALGCPFLGCRGMGTTRRGGAPSHPSTPATGHNGPSALPRSAALIPLRPTEAQSPIPAAARDSRPLPGRPTPPWAEDHRRRGDAVFYTAAAGSPEHSGRSGVLPPACAGVPPLGSDRPRHVLRGYLSSPSRA